MLYLVLVKTKEATLKKVASGFPENSRQKPIPKKEIHFCCHLTKIDLQHNVMVIITLRNY